MTVLGIDTSLRSTGYGIVVSQGSHLQAVDFGNIRNKQTLPLTECLKAIHAKIAELIATHHPDVVSIESVIYGKNAGTMLILGQARGAALTAVVNAGIPAYEYEPRHMKRAVCGNSLAEKEQIQRMVKVLLNLDEIPQNDAADALGLAIAHINSHSSVLTVNHPI